METHGFAPHNDGFPLLSRDWDDLDCKSDSCAWNRIGKCTVPSVAKIGENGRCEGFTPKNTLKTKEELPDA